MSSMSTTLLRISLRKYNKYYNELTPEEKEIVMDIYYDFY